MIAVLVLSVSAVAVDLDDNAGIDRIAPIVVETRHTSTLPELMSRLAGEQLVYVGETHNSFADHRLQLDILKAMAEQPAGLAIGVEWFQARFQSVLDDFLAGRIDEAQMLQDTEYYERWRFDYRHYRRIIQFAKENKIPIIALNASRELTSAIGRLGINDLPRALRDELPDSYDVEDKAYETTLRRVFEQHAKVDEAQFQRFVEVQLTWDESMAQRVAKYLASKPGRRMVVFAGKGHVGGRSGIPNRVTRRTDIEGITVAGYGGEASAWGEVDFLVLAQPEDLPPAGLMQVRLDSRDGGVFVRGFDGESAAKKAGVKSGDRLLAINDRPIRHFADVKLAMLEQRPGDGVDVRLLRRRLIGDDRVLSLRVELARVSHK